MMRAIAAIGWAGALALAGCGGGTTASNSPPAPCPRISILADGSDLTRFRPGAGQDLAAMTADARLIGFSARCDYTRRREGVAVTLSAVFDVERGPAATGAVADLPFFVAVTDAEDTQVIDRREFVARVTFSSNVNRQRVQSASVTLNFPAEERLVENHNVRLSFQLTPEELALNRRRGPR
ncbi:hypothetical protein J5Y09_23145 [Roseomonas sp. PWR1]|uniref:Lipoprotein n=1 Tax=Roseomonas nitratireducens TaxID=2820810 RepID=A0ABS4B021_9PROT|nr:hypothetical protein [Neoroseomonas nitratireducens]MBP0466844.1 hypothetical protein [Neoroseomonas nitratireducens]